MKNPQIGLDDTPKNRDGTEKWRFWKLPRNHSTMPYLLLYIFGWYKWSNEICGSVRENTIFSLEIY
jgi:hypothetical protein